MMKNEEMLDDLQSLISNLYEYTFSYNLHCIGSDRLIGWQREHSAAANIKARAVQRALDRTIFRLQIALAKLSIGVRADVGGRIKCVANAIERDPPASIFEGAHLV